MNFDVLFTPKQQIPVHAVLTIGAVAIEGVQLALPKGTFWPSLIGSTWIASMFVVAVLSFFINEFRRVGPSGPIHLLLCLVLYSLWRGITYARHKDILSHKKAMTQLDFLSLGLAEAFTFVPCCLMHEVLFG